MHDTSRRDLLDRLGGPNSVTVPGFLVGLAFTLVLGAAGASAAGSGPIWVVPALVGHGSAYGVLVLARRTVLRHTEHQPRPWRTVVCFAVAAVVGGNLAGGVARAITGGAPDAAEPPPPGPLAVVAVLATLLAFTLVSSFTAIVVDAWRQHQAWSAERRTWLDRLDHLRSQASDELAQQRREHHRTVAEALRRLSEVASTTPSADLAVLLRTTASTVVRPLSHRLASTGVPEIRATPPAPASFGDLIRSLSAQPLVQPATLTVLAAVPATLFALLDQPAITTLAVVGGAVAVVFVLVALLDAVVDHEPLRRSRLGFWVAGLVALALAPLGAAAAWGAGRSAAVVTGFSILVFGLLQPVWRAGRHAVTAGERERAELVGTVERETTDLRRREWVEQERLAQALHGRVQSALLASALRLGEADDEAETRLGIAATLGDLSRNLLAEPRPRSLAEAIADLRIVWAGLCHIDVETGSAAVLDMTGPTSTVLQRVVNELAANAIVHGGARRLVVHVETTDDTLVVEIEADGTLEVGGGPGLGSAILDELTTSWSVRPVGDGVVSRAAIALGTTPSVDR